MESPTKKLELITRYFADFTPKQLMQLESLDAAYQEWNAKINVISRKDMDSFYTHHVLHSLALTKVLSPPVGETIVDFGTGGGFPSVPLAVFFPENISLGPSVPFARQPFLWIRNFFPM
ncbi:MAG: hypothetical protein EBV82_07465 [Chitinophagia bacterium]|nr:hypothetical protein [Chitinophagia bacterium]